MADINGVVSHLKAAASALVNKAPDKGDDEAIKDSEEFYQEALAEQKPYHQIWYRNIAWLMGMQWHDWNGDQNALIEAPKPSWRVRFVANLILPTIRTEAAKILRSNPRMTTVPGSDSEEARSGARVGDRLLEAKYYEDDFQRVLYNTVMWMLTCGSSFMWSLWDGTAGKTWSDKEPSPDGNPILGPDGMPIMRTYHEGDEFKDVSSPFETLLEPGGPEDFNQHQRIMRVKIRSVKYIKERYGVDVPSEDLSTEVMFQGKIANLIGANQTFATANRRSLKDSVLVKEDFMLPSRQYPEGKHMIYANKIALLNPEPLDYYLRGKRALPTAKFDHITIPGRPYGMSIIEQIGPINVLFNKMNSIAVENANLMARPKVLSPVGSLDDDAWTDEPGEVVEYTPVGGLRPEPYKPPEMPQYFFLMKDSLPGLIDSVSGIFDVSRGKLPRRATSGRAIDLLQEADETKMGLTIRNFASSLERLMSISLCTMGKKYREQRLIKKIGPDHKLEVFHFTGSDLRDADTVRVVIGSVLSKSAKAQLALEMADKGLLPKNIALQIMELGDINMAFDQDQEQIQYSQIENFGMAKGILYEAGEHEPHEVHIEEHENFLRSDIGQKLSPEAKAIIQAHIQQHKALQMASLNPQVPGLDLGVPPMGPQGPLPGMGTA